MARDPTPGYKPQKRKPKRRRSIFAPVGDVLAEFSGVNEARKQKAANRPLAPKTNKFGIVVDPRGPTIGTRTVKAPTKAKVPRVTSSKGAAATASTVPSHARTPTSAKPRSIAEPTVTEKERTKAKRAKQPSRRPGAAKKRAQQTVLAGPAPALALPRLPTAQALARAEFAPTFTGYELEGQQDAAAAAERQRAVQGFTLALMKELGAIPAGVAGDFQQAATATQGVAQAAADQLRGAGTEADARLQADLAAIGAPAAQTAQATQMTGDVFGGGAGAQFYTQGASPAQALLGEGARETAFARQLPAFAALSGQQNMRQALYEAEEERQELGSRRAATLREMGARVPAYQLQLATEQTRRQEAALDAATKQRAAAANEDYLRFQMGLKTRAQTLAEAKAIESATQGRARLNQGALRLRQSAIQDNRNWNATLRRLGVSEGSLRLRAAEAQAKWDLLDKNGGWTKSERLNFKQDAASIARRAYAGEPVKEGEVLPDGTLAPQPGLVHMSYQEAMREGLAQGIPLKVMQSALNSYWTRPGQHMPWETPAGQRSGAGRPRVPYQGRRPRRKR